MNVLGPSSVLFCASLALAAGLAGCAAHDADRPYLLERVDDVAVVQLYADGFERLAPRDRVLCWHLYQAALAGRDIYLQQKCAQALDVRDLLEEIVVHSDGVDAATLAEVERYLKLFWINNGPYNAYTARKNPMHGEPAALAAAAQRAARNGAALPLREGEDPAALVARLTPLLFDPEFEPMVTAKSPEGGKDIVQASACTFYGPGVTLADLEGFEERYELNATIVKREDGTLEELPWRSGLPEEGVPPGLFAEEIEEIVAHLEAAKPHAPEATRRFLDAQIRFYRTGARADRVASDIAWVEDTDSAVDTVNGFVEVYVDPRGKKGAWEGIVSYEDPNKAREIKVIAENAAWFERHMPYDDRFKKADVKGITARAIDVVIETGDSGPVTPIGINLPNDQAIREQHGSKSVSLSNVIEAAEKATPKRTRAEFCFDAAEAARAEKWVSKTQELLVNMHEVIGHASGRQAEGRQGDPASFIREYYSALEEARADLVALWFMLDPKLVELELLQAGDLEEAALAAYEQYTRNGGLQQLRRVMHGDQLEEDHMRNRQMVVRWIQENSDAIAERTRDGKTFLVVTDAAAWREAAGRLLAEVQRIKSEGDLDAARGLFETYGIRFDPSRRDEVLARYEALDVPSYTGFVMPEVRPVRDASGAVIDATISYPRSLEDQMLGWSGRRARP